MPIRKLPPLLINQIAAGEVIERPASVVKELVDNAIDAGATRVRVVVEQGGRELIQVSDDGCGIPANEMVLALSPHATSKITEAEDLDGIATLGFRGEALASIMSVSRLTLTSRTSDQASAMKIEAEGSHLGEPSPSGGPVGTTITVRNLFFNTPARRKFLRTPQTEFNHISETVQRLALSHPRVGFTLTHNGNATLDLLPDQSPRDRALDVMGRELAEVMLEINTERVDASRTLALWGLIGTPEVVRGSAKYQHFFVNGRPVKDRTIAHAVKEAYRGLIDHTRFPMLVLYIEMDPLAVDVNVHPAKAEVRFRDSQSIHGLVLGGLREVLLRADITPQAHMQNEGQSGMRFESSMLMDQPMPKPVVVDSTRGFVECFQQMNPTQKGLVYREVKEAMGVDPAENAASMAAAADTSFIARRAERILQVHNSYVIAEDEQGILIIDQHALHERMMFEDLKARVLKEGTLESQRLLVPEVIDVAATLIDVVERMQPLLERLGIEASPMGPTSIAVHGFPSFLFERNVDPGPFMTELLDRAAAEGFVPNDEEALHEVLDMMSCKAAIKAGDSMTEAELESLLARRDEIERSGRCPHGRPTTIRLSLTELEKQFGRR